MMLNSCPSDCQWHIMIRDSLNGPGVRGISVSNLKPAARTLAVRVTVTVTMTMTVLRDSDAGFPVLFTQWCC